MNHRVLFVDDEPNVTTALRRALRREPYEILSASSSNDGLELLAKTPVDVVVADERMPGMSGTEFLATVSQKYPDTIRMMLTGQATLDAVIEAINRGQIYHFFTKPWNPAELSNVIRQALEHRELLVQSRNLLQAARQQSSVLEDLEDDYPGITNVTRDADGAIVMEGMDRLPDSEALLQQMQEEMERFKRIFGDSG